MRVQAVGLSALVLAVAVASTGWSQGQRPRKVVKTDREWARQLTHEQYMVTRLKDTEPPFTGKYAQSHAKGYYACVCCGSVLFSSKTKFDSGTGWPSFFAPMAKDRVETELDYKLAEPRVEVTCSDCGAHLGHVFNDGPAPTGLRYCMNSLALKFLTEAQYKAALDKEKAAARHADAKGSAPAPAPTPAPASTPEAKAGTND